MKRIIEIEDNYEGMLLKEALHDLNDCVLPVVGGKSVAFAIEILRALENGKPYDDSGDLISRSDLIKDFNNLASDDYNEPIWYQKTVFETIDNAPTVERPQGDYETECNVLLSLEQIVRRSEGWEDDAIEAVHNAVQTAIKCMKGGAE